MFAVFALFVYLFWFVYSLLITRRIHPIWARRRISAFGKIGWLIAYPVIWALVFSLIGRIPALESLAGIVTFLGITLIQYPTTVTAAYATTVIFNAILLSKRRRFVPIYQRL
jgi:hypothetical protein